MTKTLVWMKWERKRKRHATCTAKAGLSGQSLYLYISKQHIGSFILNKNHFCGTQFIGPSIVLDT